MIITTIDDVIAHLDEIVEICKRKRSRAGYFASLYRVMTIAVKAGIQAGRFEDPKRMTRLDVIFAGRYLNAYARNQRGERPTRAWQYAFDVATTGQALILQDLLLGINAHINLDLGIAAAEACPQVQYPPLKRDFAMINTVIADLVDGVQSEIGLVSPLFNLIDDLGGRIDEAIFNFSINRARDAAWRAGEALCTLDGKQLEAGIQRLDRTIEALARVVFNRAQTRLITFKLMRASEEQDVAKVMDVLSDAAQRRAVALIPETARELRRLARVKAMKAQPRRRSSASSAKRRRSPAGHERVKRRASPHPPE
jgi:hypothetical protein